MRRSLMNSLLSVAALTLLLVGTPRLLAAQQQDQPQQCTAQALPESVPAGQAAVQVTFTLSEDVGVIAGLQAPEGSGIKLASPEDLPRQEMANPDVAPEPIEMSQEQPNVAILWLNTTEAAAGALTVTLTSEDHTCVAQLTVTESGSR